MNMDHVPELWKELRLEFKDNLWKKYEELYDSLLEEDETINKLNTIRNRKLHSGGTGLREIVEEPEEVENKSGQILVKSPEILNNFEEIVKKSNKNPKNPLKKLHCIIC